MVDMNEEPWEDDIGALLRGMPEVEPPSGFFDAALDHRPLYSGRLMAGLVVLSAIAVTLAVATGAVGKSRVSPEIDELASRHSVGVEAGVFGIGDTIVDERIPTPVEMPEGFERSRNIAAKDLGQAIYSRGDEAVSVFVQEGQVNWDSLSSDGRMEIDGLQVWVDPNRAITVVGTTDDVVTIVGLPAEDLETVLAEVPRTGPTLGQRIHDLVAAITEQLGYPDVD